MEFLTRLEKIYYQALEWQTEFWTNFRMVIGGKKMWTDQDYSSKKVLQICAVIFKHNSSKASLKIKFKYLVKKYEMMIYQ